MCPHVYYLGSQAGARAARPWRSSGTSPFPPNCSITQRPPYLPVLKGNSQNTAHAAEGLSHIVERSREWSERHINGMESIQAPVKQNQTGILQMVSSLEAIQNHAAVMTQFAKETEEEGAHAHEESLDRLT
jgi:hypothetical protein